MSDRKLGRKVTIEIYEDGVHTQTQQSSLYKTDLEGRPITDPFKDCKTIADIKAVLLNTSKGLKYLEDSFLTENEEQAPDLILVKINKTRLSAKQIIRASEYITASLKVI